MNQAPHLRLLRVGSAAAKVSTAATRLRWAVADAKRQGASEEKLRRLTNLRYRADNLARDLEAEMHRS